MRAAGLRIVLAIFCAAVLAVALAGALATGDAVAEEERITLAWRVPADDGGPPCEVGYRYGPPPRESAPEPPWRREARKKLATWTFPLEGAPPGGAALLLARAFPAEPELEAPAPEAPAPAAGPAPAAEVAFTFELRAGPRLRIVRPYRAALGPGEAPDAPAVEERALGPTGTALARALRAQDEAALAASGIARLAVRILTARPDEPIGPAQEAVVLASVHGGTSEVSAEAGVFRVRVRPGEEVALALVLVVRARRPYVDRFEESRRPLSEEEHLAVALERPPAALKSFGMIDGVRVMSLEAPSEPASLALTAGERRVEGSIVLGPP